MTKERETAGHKPASRIAPIDWAAIHRRLASVAAVFEHGAARTEEETLRILKDRARALAREPQQHEQPGQYLTVLEFQLAHERYAVDSSFVREVCPLKELTPLPGTPAFIQGIVNVRGQIISVVNLKIFFELPERGLTDFNKIILLSDGAMEFGLLVDAVVAMHRVSLQDIQPPLPTLVGIREQYLQGVTAQRLVILAAARILADPRLVVREAAQAVLEQDRERNTS